jgi:hypothetical protein
MDIEVHELAEADMPGAKERLGSISKMGLDIAEDLCDHQVWTAREGIGRVLVLPLATIASSGLSTLAMMPVATLA